MGREIEGLATFVAETRWHDIPAAIQNHAKLVFLDTLGVTLAGSEQAEVRALRERLGADAAPGSGATVLARGWTAQDTRTAALLNGIAGRSIELCEGHRIVNSQPAVQILPGVMAMSESAQRNGAEMLTAFVLGYELAGRLCGAFTRRPLAHGNGQATLLAAVAAGARLKGLDAAGISLAMRIGATLILTPSYTNAVVGATVLNVAAGMSGYAACLAPELALAGFDAQHDAIEQSLGGLVGAGFNPSTLMNELGTRWEIHYNYFRLYACCNPVHPSLDCLRRALDELKPRPQDIERIDVATYAFAAVMANPDPPNYFASKYSFPHAAATMIVKGKADYTAMNEATVTDPEIAALRHRVHITEDPAMSAVAPRMRPARLTLTLKDGRTATHSAEFLEGDFERPYPELRIREKFRELAGVVLTAEGVAAVEAAVDRCEQWSSISELLELLRRYGRP